MTDPHENVPATAPGRGVKPARFVRPGWIAILITLGFAAFFVQGILSTDISLDRIVRGARNLWRFITLALPPDFAALDVIFRAMLETLNMAVVGVTFGVILSFPVALLAAANTTPHPLVRTVTRLAVATMRTIPDLIWALIFVIAVGLGPLAGVLAIVVDTIGYCARFFSERIEEVRPGPSEALSATGARRGGVIMGAIFPETFASMTATSLYAVEKSLRSAVTLGLVGAGGIGVELSTAMRLFRFDQAMAIIFVILVFVIGFEQISSAIRKKVI